MKLMTDSKGIQFSRLNLLCNSTENFCSNKFIEDIQHPNAHMFARIVAAELNEKILNECQINTYY